MILHDQELFNDIYSITNTNEYFHSTIWSELQPKEYIYYKDIEQVTNLRRKVLLELNKRLIYIVKKKLNLMLFEMTLCFQGNFVNPLYSSENYDNDFDRVYYRYIDESNNSIEINFSTLSTYLIPYNTSMPGFFKNSLAIIEILDHISGKLSRYIAPDYNIMNNDSITTLIERPKELNNDNNIENVCIEYNYYNHMYNKQIPELKPLIFYNTSNCHLNFY